MNLQRENFSEKISAMLAGLPFTIACWEGGSAATGSLDQFSDLDLVIAVRDDCQEQCFLEIESFLKQISPITHSWRLPEPTWHGHSQCLYKLKNTPEYFFLDIVVMQQKSGINLREPERHGKPIIHFDKPNILTEQSIDTLEFNARMQQRRKILADSFPFYKAIAEKEILRKHPVDAWAYYRQLINALVEVWGMKYRPFKYDFGLRYTEKDFPHAIHRQLTALCYVKDIVEMHSKVGEIEVAFYSTLKELDAEGGEAKIREG